MRIAGYGHSFPMRKSVPSQCKLGGTPANISGLAPRQGPLRLAGCTQKFLARPSGGHVANVSGPPLIARGVSTEIGAGKLLPNAPRSSALTERDSFPTMVLPSIFQPLTHLPISFFPASTTDLLSYAYDMADEIVIDKEVFHERLSSFVTQWKNDKRSNDALFQGVGSIVLCVGKASDGAYTKATAFQVS